MDKSRPRQCPFKTYAVLASPARVRDDEDEDDKILDQHRFKPFHEEKWTLYHKELLEFCV
jgi:hypothetical protein